MGWLHDELAARGFVAALIRAILWAIPILLLLIPAIWFERRLLGWIQDRIGPNRVGPFGLLQPIADITKLLFKEEIIPSGVDRFTYVLAPVLSLMPPIILGAGIPFGGYGLYKLLTPVSDLNIGVLYLMGVSSLGVYGLVLAGYSGNNKFSLMGGLRASAQLISYELAMGMSLAAVVLATGSLNFTSIVHSQEQPLWGVTRWAAVQNWNILTPFGFLAALVFGVCMFAETNRPPFDLPEAENELVAGYHTEYSSGKFVSFLMAEYFAMLVYGTVFATVFLGGYNMLPFNWDVIAANAPALAGACHVISWLSLNLAPLWLVGKIAVTVFAYIWVRGTLPRLRYDQLMNLGWRSLLPLAVANLVVVALWVVAVSTYGPLIGMGIAMVIMLIGLVVYVNVVSVGRRKSDPLASRSVTMVSVSPERRLVTEPADPQPTGAG
ncbi:MAG: complex I subunit 1/NuoH family protein [Fimbriimonadaceae bacterium]